MSFRNSSEEQRWLVINKYPECMKKDPSVKISKIYNNLKFNGHPRTAKAFVSRTIKRYKNTQLASDTHRKVKKKTEN